jgi:hypothetical protein
MEIGEWQNIQTKKINVYLWHLLQAIKHSVSSFITKHLA